MLRVIIKFFFPSYDVTRHQTVRYTFSLLAFIAAFIGVASIISGSESYITITTTTENIAQEQQFIIDVRAHAHIAINAIDVVIEYPENMLIIESIDTGRSVITLWTEEPYARDGNIYLRGGTFRGGFLGEHPIARIKARAVSEGEARVVVRDIQMIAGDGRGTNVQVSDSLYDSVKIVVSGTDGTLSAKAEISVVTDTNGDGKVDMKDIALFMTAWLTRGQMFDFDGDGKMTIRDFSILLADAFFAR